MSHIPYTICRSGTYYYNRRVPKHAVKAYGLFIRQALSRCPIEAEAYAKRLSDVLEGSWSRTTERVQSVDIPSVLVSFKPRSFVLSEIAKEYLTLRAKAINPAIAILGGLSSMPRSVKYSSAISDRTKERGLKLFSKAGISTGSIKSDFLPHDPSRTPLRRFA